MSIELTTSHSEFEQYEDYSSIQDKKISKEISFGNSQESAYLNKIGKIELLNKEDELVVAIAIAEGKKAADLLEKEEFSNLSEMKSLQLIRQKGEESGRDLVEANLRLAASIALRYQNKGVPLWDLIQEGNLGLMHAMRTFDHTTGNKFSTWATGKIKQYVIRSFYDQGLNLPIERKLGEQRSKLINRTRLLEQKLLREPEIDELAIEMNLSIDETQNLIKLSRSPLSLDMLIDPQSTTTLVELIEKVDVVTPEDRLIDCDLRSNLALAMFRLSTVEKVVVDARFGLSNDGKTQSFENIAEMLTGKYVNNLSNRSKLVEKANTRWGVTGVKIVENEALNSLRNDPNLQELAD